MEEKQLNMPDEHPVPKKKRKGKAGRILLLLILILVAGAAIGYYFYERSQPAKELDKYLTGIQSLDFDTMESMLQSADLSALDNADVRNATYESFFKSINAKMTWKITKTRFSFQDGTAEVTARISSLEDKFSETDIVYPMIKVNGQWKVTALDEETVKIMSANFKSVEDEISQALADSDSTAEGTDGPADSVVQTPATSDGTIDLSNQRFSIHYTRNVVSTDFGGEPCLLVYYDYTNNGESSSSAMVDVNLTAYQNDAALEAAIPANSDEAVDAFMKEIQPGETVNVCQAFSLNDMSPVTLHASDAFGLDTGITAAQTLNLQ